RSRSLAVYGLDPLHDLPSSSYRDRGIPPIPGSTFSILTSSPCHRSLYVGHLQSRPTTCRIAVRRSDRPEWNSTLLCVAQSAHSFPGQILTRPRHSVSHLRGRERTIEFV